MARPDDPTYTNSNPPPVKTFVPEIVTNGPDGTISASLIVSTIVALVIGGIMGVLLGGFFEPDSRFVAIPAGFAAAVIASVARYKLVRFSASK